MVFEGIEKSMMSMMMVVLLASVVMSLFQEPVTPPVPPVPPPPEGTFTLRIINPELNTKWWTATFVNRPQIYSGVFLPDQSWNYPNDVDYADEDASPFNRNDLIVRTFDANLVPTVVGSNLGPVEDGKNYVFDCLTGIMVEG